jgi:hypothetical protein
MMFDLRIDVMEAKGQRGGEGIESFLGLFLSSNFPSVVSCSRLVEMDAVGPFGCYSALE